MIKCGQSVQLIDGRMSERAPTMEPKNKPAESNWIFNAEAQGGMSTGRRQTVSQVENSSPETKRVNYVCATLDEFVKRQTERGMKFARVPFHNDVASREDAVHDALVKILKRPEKHGELTDSLFNTFLGWACINISRKNRREVQLQDSGDDEESEEATFDLFPASDDVEKQVILNLDNDLIHQCIQQLPPKYRDVIMLRHLLDLDVAVTASMLKISEVNVRVRDYRAKEQLGVLLLRAGFEW
jgi:RNA polymerase sigma factor (sigma-70 family)